MGAWIHQALPMPTAALLMRPMDTLGSSGGVAVVGSVPERRWSRVW